jgi:hypothetical protein
MTERDTKQALIDARLFAKTHLSELAAEIIEWQDTAILRDGRMRELAVLCLPLESNHSLKLAESLVARAAMEAARAVSPPGAPVVMEAAQIAGKRPDHSLVLYNGSTDQPYIDIDGGDLWCNAEDFTPEDREKIRWMVNAANAVLAAPVLPVDDAPDSLVDRPRGSGEVPRAPLHTPSDR